jgi:hypothetical protein
MHIRLSDLDTYRIAWAAADRCAFKEQHRIKHKRIDNKRDNFQITREGLMGEWALSIALDVPVNTELYLGTDEGTDFAYKGYTIDVKTTRAKYLLFQSLEHFKADVAALVQVINEHDVEIKGIISKKKFVEIHEVKNLGYQDNCVVPPEKLLPIEEFRKYANRYPKYQSVE